MGKFEVPLECEKSKAIVHITAVNQGNKWIIYEFKIKSDALPISPEEREVTNYSDLVRTEAIKGEKLYELDAHPEFNNGNADLHFGVVKEGGKWQLKGFNFRANTKIH